MGNTDGQDPSVVAGAAPAAVDVEHFDRSAYIGMLEDKLKDLSFNSMVEMKLLAEKVMTLEGKLDAAQVFKTNETQENRADYETKLETTKKWFKEELSILQKQRAKSDKDHLDTMEEVFSKVSALEQNVRSLDDEEKLLVGLNQDLKITITEAEEKAMTKIKEVNGSLQGDITQLRQEVTDARKSVEDGVLKESVQRGMLDYRTRETEEETRERLKEFEVQIIQVSKDMSSKLSEETQARVALEEALPKMTEKLMEEYRHLTQVTRDSCVTMMEEERAAAASRMHQLRSELSAQVSESQTRHEAELSELATKLQNEKEARSRSEASYEDRLAKVADRADQTTKELMERCEKQEAEVTALRKVLSAVRRDVKDARATEAELVEVVSGKVTSDIRSEIHAHNEKLLIRAQEEVENRAQLKTEIKTMLNQTEERREKSVVELDKKIDANTNLINDEIVRLTETMENNEKANLNLFRKYEAESLQRATDLEAQVRSQTNANGLFMDEFKGKWDEQTEVRSAETAQLESLKQQLPNLRNELETELKQLSDRLEQESMERSSAVGSLKTSTEKLEDDIKNLETSSKGEVGDLEKRMEDRRTALFNELRSSVSAEHMQRREAFDTLQSKTTALETKLQGDINALRRVVADGLDDQEAKREVAFNDCRERIDDAIAVVRGEWDAKLDLLEQKTDEVAATCKSLGDELSTQVKTINRDWQVAVHKAEESLDAKIGNAKTSFLDSVEAMRKQVSSEGVQRLQALKEVQVAVQETQSKVSASEKQVVELSGAVNLAAERADQFRLSMEEQVANAETRLKNLIESARKKQQEELSARVEEESLQRESSQKELNVSLKDISDGFSQKQTNIVQNLEKQISDLRDEQWRRNETLENCIQETNGKCDRYKEQLMETLDTVKEEALHLAQEREDEIVQLLRSETQVSCDSVKARVDSVCEKEEATSAELQQFKSEMLTTLETRTEERRKLRDKLREELEAKIEAETTTRERSGATKEEVGKVQASLQRLEASLTANVEHTNSLETSLGEEVGRATQQEGEVATRLEEVESSLKDLVNLTRTELDSTIRKEASARDQMGSDLKQQINLANSNSLGEAKRALSEIEKRVAEVESDASAAVEEEKSARLQNSQELLEKVVVLQEALNKEEAARTEVANTLQGSITRDRTKRSQWEEDTLSYLQEELRLIRLTLKNEADRAKESLQEVGNRIRSSVLAEATSHTDRSVESVAATLESTSQEITELVVQERDARAEAVSAISMDFKNHVQDIRSFLSTRTTEMKETIRGELEAVTTMSINRANEQDHLRQKFEANVTSSLETLSGSLRGEMVDTLKSVASTVEAETKGRENSEADLRSVFETALSELEDKNDTTREVLTKKVSSLHDEFSRINSMQTERLKSEASARGKLDTVLRGFISTLEKTVRSVEMRVNQVDAECSEKIKAEELARNAWEQQVSGSISKDMSNVKKFANEVAAKVSEFDGRVESHAETVQKTKQELEALGSRLRDRVKSAVIELAGKVEVEEQKRSQAVESLGAKIAEAVATSEEVKRESIRQLRRQEEETKESLRETQASFESRLDDHHRLRSQAEKDLYDVLFQQIKAVQDEEKERYDEILQRIQTAVTSFSVGLDETRAVMERNDEQARSGITMCKGTLDKGMTRLREETLALTKSLHEAVLEEASKSSQLMGIFKTLEADVDKRLKGEQIARVNFERDVARKQQVEEMKLINQDKEAKQSLHDQVSELRAYSDLLRESLEGKLQAMEAEYVNAEVRARKRTEDLSERLAKEMKEREETGDLQMKEFAEAKLQLQSLKLVVQQMEGRLDDEFEAQAMFETKLKQLFADQEQRFMKLQEDGRVATAITSGKMLDLRQEMKHLEVKALEASFASTAGAGKQSMQQLDASVLSTASRRAANQSDIEEMRKMEWYQPTAPEDPIDVAVASTLRRLAISDRIHLPRLAPGIYMADKKLSVFLQGDQVLVRQGSDYEALSSYMAKLYAPELIDEGSARVSQLSLVQEQREAEVATSAMSRHQTPRQSGHTSRSSKGPLQPNPPSHGRNTSRGSRR